MVRRFLPSRWLGYKERRRTAMELFTLGIDLGKTTFHVVGMNTRRGRGEEAVYEDSTVALHGEPEGGVDRHGSVRRFAFPGSSCIV
jgi:hypothetical protein